MIKKFQTGNFVFLLVTLFKKCQIIKTNGDTTFGAWLLPPITGFISHFGLPMIESRGPSERKFRWNASVITSMDADNPDSLKELFPVAERPDRVEVAEEMEFSAMTCSCWSRFLQSTRSLPWQIILPQVASLNLFTELWKRSFSGVKLLLLLFCVVWNGVRLQPHLAWAFTHADCIDVYSRVLRVSGVSTPTILGISHVNGHSVHWRITDLSRVSKCRWLF
jgi:hypothetical protein